MCSVIYRMCSLTIELQVLRFVEAARAAGVDVELHVQPGMVHVFALFAALCARDRCAMVTIAKEPCGCAKEPCACAKEPCGCAREPCDCAKEPCGCVKEPCGCQIDQSGHVSRGKRALL